MTSEEVYVFSQNAKLVVVIHRHVQYLKALLVIFQENEIIRMGMKHVTYVMYRYRCVFNMWTSYELVRRLFLRLREAEETITRAKQILWTQTNCFYYQGIYIVPSQEIAMYFSLLILTYVKERLI